MATVFFLNPETFEMGIFTVDNINRGKKKYAGKQFGLFFDKTETERSKVCVCFIPFSRSSLNLGEKASRLQIITACLFNSRK